jgi:hypothetical protein
MNFWYIPTEFKAAFGENKTAFGKVKAVFG